MKACQIDPGQFRQKQAPSLAARDGNAGANAPSSNQKVKAFSLTFAALKGVKAI
jgi:hypothetical protein